MAVSGVVIWAAAVAGLLWGPGSITAAPKELSPLVAIGDLAAGPARFDGHRVVVRGRVRSIETGTGRRGSEFVMLAVEEQAPDASGRLSSVRVFTFAPLPVRTGKAVLVQGTYHREGRQAGLSFEHFIEAEAVLLDTP